jgi:hypothetical protein
MLSQSRPLLFKSYPRKVHKAQLTIVSSTFSRRGEATDARERAIRYLLHVHVVGMNILRRAATSLRLLHLRF